jgi:sugar phosphate permease
MSKRGLPFIALGTAFIAIGISGQRAFIFAGVVFLIIGLVLLKRTHR